MLYYGTHSLIRAQVSPRLITIPFTCVQQLSGLNRGGLSWLGFTGACHYHEPVPCLWFLARHEVFPGFQVC